MNSECRLNKESRSSHESRENVQSKTNVQSKLSVQSTENVQSRAVRCLRLFFSMLTISAFTFGGGFVIVTLMKKKFVDELGWLSEQEMLDMTALAQSSPGPIAVNAAILVGWRVAGLLGMISAVIGTVIPPIVILSIVSFFYDKFVDNVYVAKLLKGMQAGVAAVILDVAAGLFTKLLGQHSVPHMLVFIVAFVMVMFLDINVIYIILLAALAGIALVCADKLKEGGR